MSDLIRRENVVSRISDLLMIELQGKRLPTWNEVYNAINGIPSAEPDMDEWCTECKEYDKEKHCCPRWNKVIRKTVEEMQMMGKIAKVIDMRYDHNLRRYGRCENCHREVVERYTYCPHCGARLEWNHE